MLISLRIGRWLEKAPKYAKCNKRSHTKIHNEIKQIKDFYPGSLLQGRADILKFWLAFREKR